MSTPEPALARVTAAQLLAALGLVAPGVPIKKATPQQIQRAELLCLTVLTAEDSKTRWVVVTVDPRKNVFVYGPYATADTARKVIDGGLANTDGTRGAVLPLAAAPKKEKR